MSAPTQHHSAPFIRTKSRPTGNIWMAWRFVAELEALSTNTGSTGLPCCADQGSCVITDALALTCVNEHRDSALLGRHDTVTEVRGRRSHPLVVGDYCSEVLAQPAGSGEMDSVQRPEVGGQQHCSLVEDTGADPDEI
jgi:hypothetical protein